MPSRSVDLTDRLNGFVEAAVAAGRYESASEVVREALRLLEQRQREDDLRLERLHQAVRMGGDAGERDVDDDVVDEVGEFLAALSAGGGRRESF